MPKGNDGRLLRHRLLPLLASLLVALATVALAAGCGDSSDESGSATSTATTSARRVVRVESVAQDRWTYARKRFNEMCAGCHSLADAGATGRRYDLDHASEGGVSEQHVRFTIERGEPGMPPWKDVLSEREFEELVNYIVAVARRTPGDDYWKDQLALRGEGANWSPADTERLERYARRLAAR